MKHNKKESPETNKTMLASNRSEEALEAIFNRSPFPIAVVDSNDEDILYWSQSAIDKFGHAPEKVSEWYELAYPDPTYRQEVIQRWKPFVNKVKKSKEAMNTGEYCITCKDGSVKICEIYVQYIPGNIVVTLNDVTHQRKTQNALEEYKSILDSTSRMAKVGGWQFDAKTREVTWTEEIYRRLELPLDYKPALDKLLNYYRPDEKDKLSEAFNEAMKGKSFDLELKFITTKGRELWARIICNPLFEKGKVVKLAGTFQDITERIDAEEALKNSEEKYRSIFENTALGIFRSTPEGKYEVVNEAFARILGFNSPAKMIREVTDISQLYKHPEDREKIKKEFDEKGFVKNYEIVANHPRKEMVWISVIGRQQRTQDGLTYYEGTVQDITEKKLSEIQLVESRREISKILENSLDGILLTAPDGSIYSANPAACKMFGRSEEEICNIGRAGVVDKDDPRLSNFLKIRHKQGKAHVETYLLRKDGSKFPAEVSSALFKDKKGDMKSSMIIRDITDRKKAEEDLLKALKKAEESDRLKTAFLANMSHEIRTPMNGILGFTHLLSKDELTSEKRNSYIEIIREGGNRLINTINDIIDISRIETGETNINTEECNILEIINEIIKLLTPEAQQKNVKIFSTKSLPDQIHIQTDKDKLYSIFTNLLKNAVKFTNKGEVELGYNEGDGFHEFFVKDTGIGIPEDKRDIIFNRFMAADISNSRHYEGSGLGLSITKAYVEMLGGKIWVESELGSGSTFFFTLPLNAESPTEKKTDQTRRVIHDTSILKDLTILVVDDDESSIIYIDELLDKVCKTIFHANSGKEAIDIYRNNTNIGLILMDIKMPEMNGYEAIRAIREFDKDVLIVAQTAYALVGDREKALEAGCNDYISKPIRENDLLDLLKRVS